MTSKRGQESTKPSVTANVIKLVDGSNTYYFVCDGIVHRYAIDDWSQPIPNQGRQDVATRYLRNALSIGSIRNAFGAKVIHSNDVRAKIAQDLRSGEIHVLYDSEVETRFGGYITASRQKNTTTLPAKVVTGAQTVGAPFGRTSAGQNMYNDRPAVYYSGSVTAGVWHWEAQGDGTNQVIAWYAWTGSGYSTGFAAVASALTNAAAYDQAVHKGRLYIILSDDTATAANNKLYYTTNGTSSSAATAPTVANAYLPGTRLIDDGNTLWAFCVATGPLINVFKSADNATTWSASASNISGQLRSVAKYYDTTSTAQIVFLTNDRLYYLDQTNNKEVLLYTLPRQGRGMIEFNGSLYIFMDGMQVVRYTQTQGHRTITSISPGGGEQMPSGKDFGTDANGAVVLTSSAYGIYAAWSGNGTGGSLNQELCLFLQDDGTDYGWHFIWRSNNTTNGARYGARVLVYDPVSGDLLYQSVTLSAGVEVRAPNTVRIIQAEIDPRLLTANIFETSAYAEPPLFFPQPSALSTSAWDVYLNTENLQASPAVSVQFSYGLNGAASTTTSLTAQTSNRTTVALGTGNLGINFNTIRVRLTFVATATVSGLVYHADISYLKIPPVRWMFVFRLIIAAWPDSNTVPSVTRQISNLKTIQGLSTMLQLTYLQEEGTINVLPLAKSQAIEYLADPAVQSGSPRSASWTLYLVTV